MLTDALKQLGNPQKMPNDSTKSTKKGLIRFFRVRATRNGSLNFLVINEFRGLTVEDNAG